MTNEEKLRSYAWQWEVFCAEDGEEETKRTFVQLIRKVRKTGVPTTDHFPDGSLIPT